MTKNVCKGIRSLLDLDQYLEEEPHLILKWCSLQEWFSEEWTILNALNAAIDVIGEWLLLNLSALFLLLR